MLAALRSDITYPGDTGGTVQKRKRPPCPIRTTAVPDREWIPEVAANGWLIVTRDSRIQTRYPEIEAVRANDAKMVALSAHDAGTKWNQLETLFSQWRAIEKLTSMAGPFVFTCSRTTMRRLQI